MSQSCVFLHLRLSTCLLSISLLPAAAVAITLGHVCGSYYDCRGWIPALGNIVAYERWERLVTLAATIYSAELAVISWVVYASTGAVLSSRLHKVQLGAGLVSCVLVPVLPAFGDVNAGVGIDLEVLGTWGYLLGCSALTLWLIVSITALRRMEEHMDLRQKTLFRVVKLVLWALFVLSFVMFAQWRHSYTQESLSLFNEYGFSVSRWVVGSLVLGLPVLICQVFPSVSLIIYAENSRSKEKSFESSLHSPLTMELEDYTLPSLH